LNKTSQTQVMGNLRDFPWWFLVIALIAIYSIFAITTKEVYSTAFLRIRPGILVTIQVTLMAYAFSITLGLLTGLALVSKNAFIYNAATLYVQIMRGVPILVTMLYIAFIGVPVTVDALNGLGMFLANMGVLSADNFLMVLQNKNIDFIYRGILALAISYGAFSAEIFRAGIQSIGQGQMEAAQSLGMTYFQAMRLIVLPQAIRRVLPPLGNDFISMLKDSSLISALGVLDITRMGQRYAASSFQTIPTYNIVAVLYLTMTILLSLIVRFMERKFKVGA